MVCHLVQGKILHLIYQVRQKSFREGFEESSCHHREIWQELKLAKERQGLGWQPPPDAAQAWAMATGSATTCPPLLRTHPSRLRECGSSISL